MEISGLGDPCSEFGPQERRAVVWFFVVLALGVSLVLRLSSLDRWMYDHNAQTLDYSAYRENRLAHSMLRSESVDPRAKETLSDVRRLTGRSGK